jgi:hypothetical protein
VGLEPSFDYFVRDRLSFGIAPWLTYSQSTGVDAATGALVSYRRSVAGLEPRVGLNVPIAPWLSWYPRAGLVFGGDAYDETSAGSENKSSGAFVAFHLYAPFLVHPGPHVFAGFGPSLYGELTHTVTFPSGASVHNRATTVGLGLVVGGWI